MASSVHPHRGPEGAGEDEGYLPGPNYWRDSRGFRQGKYGYHWTSVGKIVHKRERHRWSASDMKRVVRTVVEDIPENFSSVESGYTLLDFLLDNIRQIFSGVRILCDLIGADGSISDFILDLEALLGWWRANIAHGEKWGKHLPAAWEKFWEELLKS